MVRKRNDAKAARMFEAYESGMSLAEVGRSFCMSRQAVHKMFVLRGWKLRAKRRPLPFVEFLGEKYTRRRNGYYGKTKGSRCLLHRAVWEHFNGAIPEGWDIHHEDEDRSNNVLSNLVAMRKGDHTRHHQKLRKAAR